MSVPELMTARPLGSQLRRVPVWIWAFFAHEILLFGAFITPFAYPTHRYLTQSQAFSSLSHFWFQWDSLWFIEIGRLGYAHVPIAGTAFFPFVPVLVHLTGIWGAWILTQVSLAITLWLVHRWARRLLPTALQASFATLLFAFNPAAVYFSTLYSEPWTIMFALLSIELGYRRRWGWAALAGFLTATTQATGVLIGLFPLVLFCMHGYHRKWRTALGPLLWGIGCFLGIASYAAYLGIRFGHPLLFSTMEHLHWSTGWEWPWKQWIDGLTSTVAKGHIVLLQVLMWLSITGSILGVTMLYPRMKDRTYPLAFALYGSAGLLVSLSFYLPGVPLSSTVRIASVYFPMYVGMARLPRSLVAIGIAMSLAVSWYGALRFTHEWWYQ